MRFEKRAIGFAWTDEGSELVELAEAVQSRDEEAGVDRSSDASVVRDGGDDRDADDVVDVAGRQRASLLGDQDDPVEPLSGGEQRRHGDVARPPQHRVTHSRLWRDGRGRSCGVDHDRTRPAGVCAGQLQGGGDLRQLLALANRQAQERSGGRWVGCHEGRRLVAGLEQGEDTRDCACALAAAGTDDLDHSGSGW
jgi:hypothetical protein